MTQPTNKPLILAVDDEASNLALLRQILQDHYRLLFAKDGAARWRWRSRNVRTWCCST